MPQLNFVTSDGVRHEVDSTAETLMEAAVEAGIPGIDGDCGGVCSCATCHVKIDAVWRKKLSPPEALESDTLSFSANVSSGSRLSCQIPLSEELQGMEIFVPSKV